MKRALYFLLGVVLVCVLAFSMDADATTPAQTFEAECAECHEIADFSGDGVKELETSLSSIVAGTTKHKKKLTLTPAEITAMAAFLSR